jgi:diadenosine tetraphosphatase ApaH/serine/threonine PP2A family protein phosphatase
MSDSLVAVFADIHANLEALQAVLADMETLSISTRVCLGDIVGYAANPAECLERVRALDCPVVRGNHDDAAATDIEIENMRESARIGIEFARQQLSAEQRVYLGALPFRTKLGDAQFVHASLSFPRDWLYIMHPDDAEDHFALQTMPLAFCGHTHVPMVWHLNNSGNIKSSRGQGRIELPHGGKTLINVGSVGQPRDRNSAACYVIYHPRERWIEFRRVTYDIATAQEKIRQAGLPSATAERLSLDP